MRWQGRRESNNVEDRRNRPGGPSLGGPGFRLPRGKGGIILLVVVLVAGYYGVDLTGLLTGQPISQQQSTRSISPNDDEAAKFTSVILATTEDTWGQLFQKWGAAISSQTGDVPWYDAHRLWRGSVRDGAVLLPGGRYRLYRSLILR